MTDTDLRYISKDNERWRVRIPQGDKRISVGVFDSIEQATMARDSVLLISPETPQAPIAAESIDVPDNVNVVTVAPLYVSLDRCLVASDWHTPLHNRAWIKRLVLVANKLQIGDLVIPGDYFDMDSVSRHPKTQRQAGLNETLRIAGDLLVALCGVFDRLFILPGNHCRRVSTRLDEPLSFDALIHAALKGRVSSDRIITTDRDYLYIGEQETGFVVGHPRYFEGSGVPGLAKAAMRERRHAVGSHTHAMSLSWTHDARHMVLYPGHMSNADITPYLQESRGLSKFPEWVNGFLAIEHGRVQMFADGLVDWSMYGA